MAAAGAALQTLAHDIQLFAAATGDFAKAHPKAAEAIGAGAIAGGAGAGGWLTLKLFTGISKLLGFGGGSAAGGAVGAAEGAAAGAAGWLGRLGTGMVGAASLPGLIDFITGDNRMPQAKAIDAAILADIKGWLFGDSPGTPRPAPWPTETQDLERSRRSRLVYEGGGFIDDPEAARGRAYQSLNLNAPREQTVSVSGAAQVEQTLHLEVDMAPDLRAKVDRIEQMFDFSVPLNVAPTGRMDTDAAPQRGIGRM
jgi:hypothetical protein